jgi:YrbI family 3-deoxy-D-manno-octulosonate 8-phosphate phosphatase
MNPSVVAFIPVRGGSKSIPLKNIKPIAGRPLVHWTVEAALECSGIDKVYVATDSDAIRNALASYAGNSRFELVGRSPETATDAASTESAMLDFANGRVFDTMILIQATSPLLTAEDLSRGLAKYEEPGVDSVLSVVRQKRFIWEALPDGSAHPMNYDFTARPRRQEFDGYLVENGAFYITSRENLLKTRCRLTGRVGVVEMDEATYFEIDEPSDWIVVEKLLTARENRGGDFSERAWRVRLFATDVDGVLTDAGMYYSESGDEMKKFNTRDGMGFSLLRHAGIRTAICTSEETEIVARRAAKLKIDYVRQGVKNKVECLESLAREAGVGLEEICFIGDDRNDTEALRRVGLACTPSDGIEANRAIAHFITKAPGGGGCVREAIEAILNERGGVDRP